MKLLSLLLFVGSTGLMSCGGGGGGGGGGTGQPPAPETTPPTESPTVPQDDDQGKQNAEPAKKVGADKIKPAADITQEQMAATLSRIVDIQSSGIPYALMTSKPYYDQGQKIGSCNRMAISSELSLYNEFIRSASRRLQQKVTDSVDTSFDIIYTTKVLDKSPSFASLSFDFDIEHSDQSSNLRSTYHIGVSGNDLVFGVSRRNFENGHESYAYNCVRVINTETLTLKNACSLGGRHIATFAQDSTWTEVLVDGAYKLDVDQLHRAEDTDETVSIKFSQTQLSATTAEYVQNTTDAKGNVRSMTAIFEVEMNDNDFVGCKFIKQK